MYIPAEKPPADGYGLTLLLHSLSANYNQYYGSRNQSQFCNRANPSIVITPEARGPDQECEGLGAAGVFEAWAEIAALYHLNPAYTDITAYSTAASAPSSSAPSSPTCSPVPSRQPGSRPTTTCSPRCATLPALMWNASAEELVNASDYGQTASKLSGLGCRYELDVYRPCASTLCSPLFPNHLMLAINDQFAPPAAFLGSAPSTPTRRTSATWSTPRATGRATASSGTTPTGCRC